MPRASKLSEFLGPEEETDSTSDSIGSFFETLQALRQKDRRCWLESLYPSDPDSDESLSEEDEDPERFLQDKGRGKPQVQYPPSSR